MSLLSESLKDKEFDVRIVTRKLAKGLLLEEAVKRHEKTLVDESDLAETVNLDEMFETVQGKSGLR